MEIKNAKIESTMLGFEDHGIFTYMIYVGDGSSGQGFGGYSLGGNYTDAVIKGLLKTVGVDKWEDLKGSFVRVKSEEGRLVEIGHLMEEKWFDPKTVK